MFVYYLFIYSNTLLGHSVSREEIVMDPDKVNSILAFPAPTTTKVLTWFLGQIWWHNRMLHHLANFASPFMRRSIECASDGCP